MRPLWRQKDKQAVREEVGKEMLATRSWCLGGDESYEWGQGLNELDLADDAKSRNFPKMRPPLSGHPSSCAAIPRPHDSILTVAHALQEVLDGLGQLAWLWK